MARSGLVRWIKRPLRPIVRVAFRLIWSRPLLRRLAGLGGAGGRGLPAAAPAGEVGAGPGSADPNAPYVFVPGPSSGPNGILTVENLFHLSRAL